MLKLCTKFKQLCSKIRQGVSDSSTLHLSRWYNLLNRLLIYMKRCSCKPDVRHRCLLLQEVLLGKSCSVANRSKRTADIEYIFTSGALGENREAKYYFPSKREHFSFADLSKKVSQWKNVINFLIHCVKTHHFHSVWVKQAVGHFFERSTKLKCSHLKGK